MQLRRPYFAFRASIEMRAPRLTIPTTDGGALAARTVLALRLAVLRPSNCSASASILRSRSGPCALAAVRRRSHVYLTVTGTSRRLDKIVTVANR